MRIFVEEQSHKTFPDTQKQKVLRASKLATLVEAWTEKKQQDINSIKTT